MGISTTCDAAHLADTTKGQVGKMLKENSRLCDVCGEVIPKGTKYAVNIVPKGKAELFRSLNDSDPEMSATTTVDARGNIRLDICLECRINMNIKGGTEQVN